MEFPIIDFHAHFPVANSGFYDQWEEDYVARFGVEKRNYSGHI